MVNSNTTHLLVRHQEITLKGKNRAEFENRLRQNIQQATGKTVARVSDRFVIDLSEQDLSQSPIKEGTFRNLQSTCHNTHNLQSLIDLLANIPGVHAIAPCHILSSLDVTEVLKTACLWLETETLMHPKANSFAVRTRRVNKAFPLTSTQLDAFISDKFREKKPGIKINLKNPEIVLDIEIRNNHVFFYSAQKSGLAGTPLDLKQRVVCLLSGGIDSPVAAFEIMKRGCVPVFVHFHSFPFTSSASLQKVEKLASILQRYSSTPLELWQIPFLEAQKKIKKICNERYRTIHYRRFMMKIAQEVAERRHALALVTGESLGQVASQTLVNMGAIEAGLSLPVLRPLLSWTKSQIVTKAQEIGTFETSIEPHDDTCQLFAPRRPSTKANLSRLLESEEYLKSYEIIFDAIDRAEKVLISNQTQFETFSNQSNTSALVQI